MCTRSLITAFAAQIELYQKRWSEKYEFWFGLSVTYGGFQERQILRGTTKQYAMHSRYLAHTVDGLERSLEYVFRPIGCSGLLRPVLLDFEHLLQKVDALHALYTTFLDRQVDKKDLEDSQSPVRQAEEAKRLSYLVFFFAPLSLIPSFFGMNIKELGQGGAPPVWRFAITAFVTLIVSGFAA